MENEQVINAIKALETIKQECENSYDCYSCPYEKTICFDDTPDNWNLNTLKYKLLQGGEKDGD